MRRLSFLVLAAGLFSPALAAPPSKGGAEELPPGAMYRYVNENNRVVLTSTLPREAIYLGYEIIDPQGRVLSVVEKALPEEERRKQQEELSQRQRDDEIRKLYPTASDAERALERKIAAIRLNIDYAQNTMSQLNSKLAAEVSAAAQHEKAGRPIPENMQATIDQFTRQIREQNAQIEQFEADIEEAKEQFAPIINRLKKLGYE